MWKRGKNKYGAKKKELAGRTFDSGSEANLFLRLSLEERGGRIRNFLHHPKGVYLSKAKILYKPDFFFIVSETGQERHAEYKGFETSDWRIKRRLWEAYGPTPLDIWKGAGTCLKLIETVGPGEP